MHKPVRKHAPVKRRKPMVVTPEEPKLAAVDTDMEDAEILSFTDDAEDVLAGAVNGNMHPESVSDYNPLYDSAFAEEEKTDTAAQSKKKPAVQTESSKQYQEGRKYKFPTADLRKYRDEICCDAVHPEQLDTGLPSRREKLLRIARIVLPPVCTFAAIMAAGWVVTGGAGWLWLAALASGGVLLGRCMEKWL